MKPLTIVLAVSTFVCVIALAWVLGTPNPPDPRVAKMESELKEARDTIAQLRRDLANKPVASTSGSLRAGSLNLSPAVASAPGADAPAASAGGTAAAMREMLKNPAMRDLLSQQQAVQIEIGYARLFEHLQLNDEEKANFKMLLTERAKIEADLGLKLLDAGLTPQQRQQFLADAEKNKTAFDETIRKFLNDDKDWNSFQSYEAVRPERTQYETMGRSAFNASGEPLSVQQEDQLIQLLAQVRQSPPPEQAALLKSMTNPSQMNEANLQTFLEYQRAANTRAQQQAAAFLSPVQLRAFQNYQNQMLEMTTSGWRMGGMITGGK